MDPIVLRNREMQAIFSPLRGMNLMQLTKGSVEIIDLKTRPLFDERFAGLGSLIGPHFHHRPKDQIPEVPSESLFPHIARVKAKGVLEPFSHGIARYAPWEFNHSEEMITATLSGNDLWNGVPLSTLEGFSFQMEFKASLLSNGLSLELSVESEKPSLVGLHYYYTLPLSGGRITADVEGKYRIQDEWKPIPSSLLDKEGKLSFDATQECDFGFLPKGKECAIFYENEECKLKISFHVEGGEPSFQLYRPKDASYICIEPLSAKDPKHPVSKKNRLQVKIEVLEVKT